jgi:phospholipid/cholesterol/gamma-HCH transport system substrate-binding protein
METRASYVMVGAFVLALVAATFAFVVFLARVEFEREPNVYLINFTGTVTGLGIASAVRYRGVPVGSVQSIRIDPTDIARIEVLIDVDPTVPIKEDMVASLGLQGITGVAYVQLTGGTQASPPIAVRPGERYPEIASRPSDLEKILENLPKLFEDAIGFVDRLSRLLDDKNQAAIAETLENVRRLSASLSGDRSGIDKVLAETALAAQAMRQTAETLDRFTKGLEGKVGPLGDSANVAMGEMQTTLIELRRATAAFGKLAGDLSGVIAENRRPLHDFSANGLYELSQFVTEARVLVANLARLTQEIERDPARFFFGDTQRGYEAR